MSLKAVVLRENVKTLKPMLMRIPTIPIIRIAVSLSRFADLTIKATIAVIDTERTGEIPNRSENEKTIHSTSTRIYERKNKNQIRANVGSKTGTVYRPMYPKNDGMATPACSAMDFTIKFGPLPIYVHAPKNTAPMEIAFKYTSWLAI